MSRRTARQKSAAQSAVPLDAVGREALELFARALARCGFAPTEAARALKHICEHLPPTLGRHGTGSSTQSDDAAHVLTLWFTEPEYVTDGQPRPLFLRGAPSSIENLVRRIQPGPSVGALTSLPSVVAPPFRPVPFVFLHLAGISSNQRADARSF